MMENKKGFTLVELMLVVIIIGVLVAMVMPRLAGRSEQARVAAAEADIKSNIALALDLFELDNGAFPTNEQGLNALKQNPDAGKFKNWKGPYLKKEPLDPWGNPYKYVFPSAHGVDYDLYSLGPDGKDDGGGGDDVTNWSKQTTGE